MRRILLPGFGLPVPDLSLRRSVPLGHPLQHGSAGDRPVQWLMCGLALSLLSAAAAPTASHTRTLAQLPRSDRVRLTEAIRLVVELGGRVWPGWERTAIPVLLI